MVAASVVARPFQGRDQRATNAVGRQARLELTFERRRGRTVIAHAYAEPPFRIGPAFAIDDAAYLIIVCSGPGVFAGDRLHQSVRVEPGARVVLTSQSALQVHPAAPEAPPRRRLTDAAVAIVRQEYHVADDAELHCHWDPVIPFADSAIVQRFDIALHAGGRLYWSDALMSGRVSRGEAWRFRELVHELRLDVGGSLQYLERYRLVPGDRDVTRPWVAGDANYLATTLVHHPSITADEVEALRSRIARLKPGAPIEPRAPSVDARAARAGMEREASAERSARVEVDCLEPRLMIGRAMACSGTSFAASRAAMRAALLQSIFQSPALAGRK